jgi:hypothetical protein
MKLIIAYSIQNPEEYRTNLCCCAAVQPGCCWLVAGLMHAHIMMMIDGPMVGLTSGVWILRT